MIEIDCPTSGLIFALFVTAVIVWTSIKVFIPVYPMFLLNGILSLVGISDGLPRDG
jgi:hypothetical protein